MNGDSHGILVEFNFLRHDDLNITAGVQLVFRLEAEIVGHQGARFVVFRENLHIPETAWRGCIDEPVHFSNFVAAGPIEDREAER